MKAYLFAGSLVFFASSAFAATTLSCDHYAYEGVLFATIKMTVKSDGHIERLADLTHYGQTRQTAVEEQTPAADELYNLVVEADSHGNELGLVIYKAQAVGSKFRAVLINPHVPYGKEMQGECSLSLN